MNANTTHILEKIVRRLEKDELVENPVAAGAMAAARPVLAAAARTAWSAAKPALARYGKRALKQIAIGAVKRGAEYATKKILGAMSKDEYKARYGKNPPADLAKRRKLRQKKAP